MSNPNLVLIGGKPYSGKSSIAAAAAKMDQSGRTRHLSMGDQLRAIGAGEVESAYSNVLKANTEELKSHAPVSSETAIGVFMEFVQAKPADVIIIDGFPRYPDRVEGFRQAVKKLSTNILAVCRVEVPDSVVHERSKERQQRFNDVEEDVVFVEKRLNDYRTNALPVLDILSFDYLEYRLDGRETIEENATALTTIIATALSRQ